MFGNMEQMPREVEFDCCVALLLSVVAMEYVHPCKSVLDISITIIRDPDRGWVSWPLARTWEMGTKGTFHALRGAANTRSLCAV